jgi:hypothetical protein
VNPIRLVSGAVTLPAHAAAAVIGTTVGVATTGARTTVRVLGRVIEQVSGSEAPARPWPADRAEQVESTAPAATTTAKKAPAKKAPAKKAPARKAPSAQAAVLAPALGLSEAEVEAGSVASESDVLRRAADTEKG